MSSFKSYFRKKHKYETQSDLKYMTPEQIVNLHPSEVGFSIEQETGGIPLEGVKRRAMFLLLSIKKREKETPNEKARQSAINRFLEREGIKSNHEVDKLMVDTHTEMIKEQLEMKDIQNRLRKLNNQKLIPDTEEETLFRRLNALKGGKRKSSKLFGKTVSKRKRREKTRKQGFKGRRTRIRVVK